MEELKVGDVVRLKSGGPKMVVSGKVNESLTCVWYTGEGHGYSTAFFDPACVDKVDE